MVFIDNLQTIGTVGRDFATHTLWEAALPANLTTGDGRTETGESHDDSPFDELFTISGQTTDVFSTVALVAAQGKFPVIKPDGLGGGPAITANTKRLSIDGITIDGSLGLSSLAGITIGAGQEGGTGMVTRCRIKDTGDDGFRSSAAGGRFAYCIAHDCDVGFAMGQTSAGGVSCSNCAAYGNTGDGFQATNANPLSLTGCWSFANGANFADPAPGGVINGNGAWSDDGTISILGGGRKNVQILPGAVNANFVNVAARNFDLVAASAMRNGGHRWFQNAFESNGHDISGRGTLNHYGSLRDVGPYQPSLGITAELLGGGKLVIGVI